ncbi:MAG: hypothetical protein JO038_05960 [Alphaproteobacteria bacterium]|nr:hypothetical protein [Alphaproteobacteria bacterium]
MPRNPTGDYEIGYGKPPRHTRFKKGVSGNPRGRRKGEKNLRVILNRALTEPLRVAENGRRRTASKLEVILTRLINAAVQADLPAIKVLLGLLDSLEARPEADPAAAGFTEEDEQVIATIRARTAADREPGP